MTMINGSEKSRQRKSDNTGLLNPVTEDVVFVESNYGLLSDNLRRHVPGVIQCTIFCGGKQCQYENPDCWDSTHMAIDGIFSHWVTDDILAMARPCTEVIIKKNIIKQFKSVGVKSLINLQRPGEHGNCGCPLEKSGFTYDPALFMENNIYYYNFGWDDYGEMSQNSILDMVKIISFSLTEGKVAIHCHAGLGRTGVLIACYLVYKMKMKANKAIAFVRIKRPNAVQTRGQIQCVQEFEQMVWSQNIIFPIKDQGKEKKPAEDFTLLQYLKMQKILLHGAESRCFRYIPKIICVICERLLKLVGLDCRLVGSVLTLNKEDSVIPSTASFFTANNNISYYQYMFAKRLFTTGLWKIPQSTTMVASVLKESTKKTDTAPISDTAQDNPSSKEETGNNVDLLPMEDLVNAVTADHSIIDEGLKKRIRQYQEDLNCSQSSWDKLKSETDMILLTSLLFDWMEQLKSPILNRDYLTVIVLNYTNPEATLRKFQLVTQYTIEYLFRFIAYLYPVNHEETLDMIRRVLASLTQQAVLVKGRVTPSGKDFNRLRAGTCRVLMEWSTKLLDLIKENIKEQFMTEPEIKMES